jgi:hypothetical protein
VHAGRVRASQTKRIVRSLTKSPQFAGVSQEGVELASNILSQDFPRLRGIWSFLTKSRPTPLKCPPILRRVRSPSRPVCGSAAMPDALHQRCAFYKGDRGMAGWRLPTPAS